MDFNKKTYFNQEKKQDVHSADSLDFNDLVQNFMLEDPATKQMLMQILNMFPDKKPLEDFMTYHMKNKAEQTSVWTVVRNQRTGQLAVVRVQ